MFRWWIDGPGDIPKIVCNECGFGYAEGEDIIKGEVLECPRCHKKEIYEMEIYTISNQKKRMMKK